MPYYIVFWAQVGPDNGWDLVHAKSKEDARKKFYLQRSPAEMKITDVLSESEDKRMFEDLERETFDRARGGEVVNVEWGH